LLLKIISIRIINKRVKDGVSLTNIFWHMIKFL